MKYLFVTSRFPVPARQGRWLRVRNLARALGDLGHQVSLLSPPGEPEDAAELEAAGVEVRASAQPHPGPSGPGRFRGSPYVYDPHIGPAIAAALGDADVVILCGAVMMQYAAEAQGAPQLVVDMVDDPLLEERRRLWRRRCPIQIYRGVRFIRRHRRYERRYRRPVGQFLFVSEADCESFRKRNDGCTTRFLPNGVDYEYFRRRGNGHAGRPPDDRPPGVVFLGHMGNWNNEVAADYLVRKVAPRIWREAPRTRIVLAGANPGPRVRALAGERVTVTGFVDDLRPYLWDADVALIPMRTGTGIKNKILEVWAAGVPTVATPLSCQGIPTVHERNILIGSTPAELAGHTLRLLADRSAGQALASCALECIRSEYTWDAIARRLLEMTG